MLGRTNENEINLWNTKYALDDGIRGEVKEISVLPIRTNPTVARSPTIRGEGLESCIDFASEIKMNPPDEGAVDVKDLGSIMLGSTM